jgi:tetraprenyl-beta-curcumene synthase
VVPRGCISIVQVWGFACAARRYWLDVFPCARAELNVWWRRAEQIPDRTLREAALDALREKSDVQEAAVAFAVLVPPATLIDTVRAITAFEIAFDYLDMLVEMPNPDPVLNGRSLCRAVVSAFEPGLPHPHYYKHHSTGDDGGYLVALVEACRTAVDKLPSFALVAEPVRRALSRIVTYQSLNHGDAHGSHAAFQQWAHSQSTSNIDLRWWETGAAMGSQLSVLALIAAAADPTMVEERVAAIEHAYSPWIAALSTLLDSVVDQYADRRDGQPSLVDYYDSPQVAAERMRLIAVEARRAVLRLPDAANHMMILAAMAAFFDSIPQASGEVKLSTRAALDTMGGCGRAALLFFRARRVLARISPPYPKQISRRIISKAPQN